MTMQQRAAMEWSGERLAYLDFLRGFAVLGLLLMNITHMGLFEVGYAHFEPSLFSDRLVEAIKAVLFDGRFRSLFCLLFGIGLYLQSLSYQKRDLASYPILKTRVRWLLVFGLLHCILIWPGDILILYALSGLYLIGRLDWSSRKLLSKGKLYFGIGILITALETFAYWYFDQPINRDSAAFTEAYNAMLSGYGERVIVNAAVALIYIVSYPVLAFFYIVGVMLIGIGLFKNGKLTQGFESKEVSQLIWVTLLVSAINAYLALFYSDLNSYFGMLLGSVSGLTMALLIWHWVLKTKVFDSDNLLVAACKRVGGMALTFYILQSLAMTMLLQVLNPDWILTFTQFDYMKLAVGFIFVQLLLGYLYKQYFKQGPLEFVWRKVVEKKVKRLSEQVQKPSLKSESA